MEHTGYWGLIRRFAALIAVLTVLGAALGAYMHFRDSTGYAASVRVYGNIKRADTVAVSQSTSLAVQRMGSYVKLVNTTRLADRVISRLGLTGTPSTELADRMSASLDKDTVIMTINVAAVTPDEAKAIADVVPAELTSLVNQLVDVPITDPNAAVFTVVDGPFVRANSSVFRAALSIIFGAVIGAAIGLAVASVRARRLAGRSPDGLALMTGLPVVGIISGSERLTRRSPAEREEARRLAYLRLARNLPQVVRHRHRVLVMTSPSGRPPATATTLGLAKALAQRGQSVLLLDATGEQEGAAALLGAHPKATAVDVISSRESLSTAATHTSVVNLDVLPLGDNEDPLLTLNGGSLLDQLLMASRAQYDTVLVDAVGVLSHVDQPLAVEKADAVLLVVDQTSTPWQDTRLARDSLRAMTPAPLGLVLEGAWRSGMPRAQYEAGLVLPADVSRDPEPPAQEPLGRVADSQAFEQLTSGAKQV